VTPTSYIKNKKLIRKEYRKINVLLKMTSSIIQSNEIININNHYEEEIIMNDLSKEPHQYQPPKPANDLHPGPQRMIRDQHVHKVPQFEEDKDEEYEDYEQYQYQPPKPANDLHPGPQRMIRDQHVHEVPQEDLLYPGPPRLIRNQYVHNIPQFEDLGELCLDALPPLPSRPQKLTRMLTNSHLDNTDTYELADRYPVPPLNLEKVMSNDMVETSHGVQRRSLALKRTMTKEYTSEEIIDIINAQYDPQPVRRMLTFDEDTDDEEYEPLIPDENVEEDPEPEPKPLI
jgi:hypothetical protein